MKTNLLLLVIILVGGWYLFHPVPPEPEPAPVVVSAPVQRADYSGTRTYYSPLNDPAVPADTNYGTRVPVYSGTGATGQTGLALGGTARVYTPTTVAGPNRAGVSNDGSNLDVSKRSADIARAAKGE